MSLVDEKELFLTTDDIAALRAAESVQFCRDYDGASCVKLILSGTWDTSAPRIYTARQQRLFPHTSTMSGDRYRKLTARSSIQSVLGGATEHARCDHTLRRAQDNDEWQTIARIIKPGDVVGLRWRSGNDYQLITDVGLHRDELRMVLRRDNNNLRVFLIDAAVCADDTASMIRL